MTQAEKMLTKHGRLRKPQNVKVLLRFYPDSYREVFYILRLNLN